MTTQGIRHEYKSNVLKKGVIVFDIEPDEEVGYIASFLDISIYGAGGTIEDAAEDCFSMLLDLYKELASAPDTLSPHLLRELNALRELLKDDLCNPA